MSTEGPAALAGVEAPQPLAPDSWGPSLGVLGRIARERAHDYAGAAVSYPATAGAEPTAAERPRPAFAASLLAARDAARAASQPLQLAVIAEVKRASPSQGAIAPLDPVEAARAYRAGGAAALSVLTGPRHLGGGLAHLAPVAAAVGLPLLRQALGVHPAPAGGAAASGASAVLPIGA